MRIGGFGELENVRKAISRDDNSKINNKRMKALPLLPRETSLAMKYSSPDLLR